MRNFIKKHDVLTKLLAIGLAVALWGIVMMEKDPFKTVEYKDIPIQIIGEDALLEERGLAIIDGEDATVSLLVNGRISDLAQTEKSRITVTVDVSNIRDAGTKALTYEISLPKRDVELTERRPQTIELVIDEMITKEVSVTTEINGSAPGGYRYGKPQAAVETITIEGPKTVLDTVVTAQAQVTADGLTSTQRIACAFILLDGQGTEVVSPYVTHSISSIPVSLTVSKVATVPLEVKLLPSAEITADMAKVTIDPATIEVYGDEATINKLTSIQLGMLDLGREETGSERTMAIRLPEGVKRVEGQPATARVTLQIDGMASRKVSISDIHLNDTNTAEVKPSVQLGAQAVEVTLSGKNSLLTALSLTEINVQVTFDSAVLGAGTHQVPVTVTVAQDAGVVVLSYTEQIAITIADAAPVVVEQPPEETGAVQP